MNHMDYSDILQKLDLSPSEAKAYMAIVQSGELQVAHLAPLINATKMAGYLAVDALVKKELIVVDEKNGKKMARVLDPRKLLDRLHDKEAILDKQERQLGAILPELVSLYETAGKKPSIRIYNGIDGLVTLSDFLTSTKPIQEVLYFIPCIPKKSSVVPIITQIVADLDRASILTRGLVEKGVKTLGGSCKTVAYNKRAVTNILFISDNSVFMISHTDEVGMIIESQQIADTQRMIVDLAWRAVK